MELPAGALSSKLFIGGLAAQTTTEVLRAHFEKYGRIVDAVVMVKQGKPRGFGFVAFETAAGATAALAEPQWLGDRFVDVKRAVPGEQPVAKTQPNKVFVGGLPQDATTEDLRACFAAYGPIADAVVMVDRRTKRSRGFGFIRFASSPQGSQAVDGVLRDAANHSLGGKWIEVKKASPAAQMQDFDAVAFSPMASPSRAGLQALSQQLQQLHVQAQHPWLYGAGGAAMPGSPASPQAREHQQRLAEAYGMYSPMSPMGAHWSALMGAADAFGGMHDWEYASTDASPVCSPMAGHFGGGWPLTPGGSTAGHGAVQRSMLFGPGVAASPAAGERSPMTPASEDRPSSPSHSDEENKPGAGNRSTTPTPSKKITRPPGLGIEASPMKVDFPRDLLLQEDLLSPSSLLAAAKKPQPQQQQPPLVASR